MALCKIVGILLHLAVEGAGCAMDGKSEIELVGVRNHFNYPESLPGVVDHGEDVFWLAVVISGMRRGVFSLPGGRPFYTAASGSGAVMLLMPPGATSDAAFVARETEAYSFFFKCPSLRYDAGRGRMFLTLADGRLQRMHLAVRLGEHEVVTIRPIMERAVRNFWNSDDAGCAARAQLFFHAVFAQFFDLPFAREEYDVVPEKKLEKLIEREGHKMKLREMARETKHSLRWTRERFRREFGVNPSDFKKAQTLHLAKYYITRTKLPFKKIADRLGFSSANYLAYYVRRHLGRTPRELRAAEAAGKVANCRAKV